MILVEIFVEITGKQEPPVHAVARNSCISSGLQTDQATVSARGDTVVGVLRELAEELEFMGMGGRVLDRDMAGGLGPHLPVGDVEDLPDP